MRRKIDLLLESFGTQRGKDWFRAETFLSLARLRGMECRASDHFAEAFHVRKLALFLTPRSDCFRHSPFDGDLPMHVLVTGRLGYIGTGYGPGIAQGRTRATTTICMRNAAPSRPVERLSKSHIIVKTYEMSTSPEGCRRHHSFGCTLQRSFGQSRSRTHLRHQLSASACLAGLAKHAGVLQFLLAPPAAITAAPTRICSMKQGN